jgi:predicted nucleotidyltransferase component of viral defense system
MEKQERTLTPIQIIHKQVMQTILQKISSTPLVLKGGTALMLAYGCPRFSDDLDFDAPRKINLESCIRHGVPAGVTLLGFDTLKNTETVTRYRVRYASEHGSFSLKLEISYRTPASESEVTIINGMRVSTLPRIIDQKLNAAHDSETPRTKIRDLYDLAYISRHFPSAFTRELALRLNAFVADPDAIVSRFRDAFEEDEFVRELIDLENLALQARYSADKIMKTLSCQS